MTQQRQRALRTVRRYSWWSAGAGLIPIHYLDWVAVSGVQLKMLAQVSRIYDVPFEENLGKAAIGSVFGFIVPHAAAVGAIGTVVKAVPGLGGVAGAPLTAMFAGAYAWALGNLFIQHFECGGTLLNFNPAQMKAYFEAQFEGKTAPTLEVPV